MAKQKAIAVGDPVLWYGFDLEVTDVLERGDVTLVEVTDVNGLQARDEAFDEVRKLREEQAELKGGQRYDEIRKRIGELDGEMRKAVVRAKLRADLLSFWEERGVWVSDGRILTDAQQEAFTKMTGQKCKPEGQRLALQLLESAAGKEA